MNSLENIGGVAPPPEYTNAGVCRSSVAGGSAKGPSSRLTVALRTVSGTKKAVSVVDWQINLETGTKKGVSVPNWQKKPELVTKWGCFWAGRVAV